MILPIYVYGSEILRQVAEPVDLSDKEGIQALVQDLKDTLAKAEGCGLAAPQVGVSKRVVIVDGRDMADVYPYLDEKKAEYQEGCLSIPGIYCDVVRPESMTVEYYDENLRKVTETFDKFACRMVQHEMSHLDGDLFVDHVSQVRKKIISKKLQGIAKGKVFARYTTKLK